MSRSTGSSRHRSRAVDGDPQGLVEQVKTIVTLLYDVVSSRPQEWESYLESARSAITALDHLRFFRDPQRLAEQLWILHGLQDFAFHDADSGSIQDIAEWCQTAWLRILRNFPENVEVLTGKPRASPPPTSGGSSGPIKHGLHFPILPATSSIVLS